MIKHTGIIVAWGLGASLAWTLPAGAGSIETIDCHADRNPAERRICASQHLQVLDALITERYADLMLDRRNPASVRAAARHDQRAFLIQRDRCGPDSRCLEDVMHLRLAELGRER